VTRARDNRIARLAADAVKDETTKGLDRCKARVWRTVCGIVRDELTRSGIDPARVIALRLCEAHDPSELERADEEFALAGSDILAGMFAAKIGDQARRYEDGHEPDFPDASLAELFAWCLARRADGAWRVA
jgi:hypothetical protein